jgi:hypothetical protein
MVYSKGSGISVSPFIRFIIDGAEHGSLATQNILLNLGKRVMNSIDCVHKLKEATFYAQLPDVCIIDFPNIQQAICSKDDFVYFETQYRLLCLRALLLIESVLNILLCISMIGNGATLKLDSFIVVVNGMSDGFSEIFFSIVKNCPRDASWSPVVMLVVQLLAVNYI